MRIHCVSVYLCVCERYHCRVAIKTNRTQTLCTLLFVFMCVCASESYHCRLRSKQTVHTLSLCTKCSIVMFVCVLVAATQLLHVKTTQLLQRKHVLYSVQQQICACKQTVPLLLHEQNRRGGGGTTSSCDRN